MSGVRVRFAPSPTGYLHIGGARTALYNWLLARHEGGAFVLRIEDTDRERSKKEYRDAILDDLRWLGLDWDEGPEVGGPRGPYFQSERADSYAPHLDRLLERGLAYRCYCAPEELEERRRTHPAGPDAWRYDRRCLSVAPEEAARLAGERPAVIRFRVPEGTTSFDDVILGPIEVENAELDDLVIARADGTPTYNLAVVVDDLEMGITHVVRGSDHLSNTPRQVLLWRALGHEPPTFGHLPLVLSQDGQVLSKRRGAVAVGEYRRMGYLPEALVNYMALLGWAYDGEQEFFARGDLVEKFEIGRVSGKAAAFDPEKLTWMNAQWIKRLDVSDRTDRLVPLLRDEGLLEREPIGEHRRWLENVVSVIDDRLKTLRDVLEFDWFFLASDVAYDSIAVNKVLAKPGAGDILAGLRKTLSGAPDFEPETLERLIRDYADEVGLKAGKVIQPVRVAVTGKTASPGIFETLSLLGRDRVLARIDSAARLIS
jgi:glutamyl-tRNA synthetase